MLAAVSLVIRGSVILVGVFSPSWKTVRRGLHFAEFKV